MRGLARGAQNREPDKIILPFSLGYSQSLWSDSISSQEVVAGFTGLLSSSYQLQSIYSFHPIPRQLWHFLMLIKPDMGFLTKDLGEKDTTHILSNPSSMQIGELLVLLKFLCCQQEPVNIFSDCQYAVQNCLYPVLLYSRAK